MTSATAVDAAVRAYLERDADYADLTSDTAIEQRVGSIRRRRRAARVSVVATCAFMVLAGVALVNHDPAPSGPRVLTDSDQNSGPRRGEKGSTPTTVADEVTSAPATRVVDNTQQQQQQRPAAPRSTNDTPAAPAPRAGSDTPRANASTETLDPSTEAPVVSPPNTSVTIPTVPPVTPEPPPVTPARVTHVEFGSDSLTYWLTNSPSTGSNPATGLPYVEAERGPFTVSVASFVYSSACVFLRSSVPHQTPAQSIFGSACGTNGQTGKMTHTLDAGTYFVSIWTVHGLDDIAEIRVS